jgi:hypothetical protein
VNIGPMALLCSVWGKGFLRPISIKGDEMFPYVAVSKNVA